jgi:MFS superfamily sulfate permease-like transporter
MIKDLITIPKNVNWNREFLASIVVFLVALPLCMGIAIASGVPPALGLITGIVGGLVVGFFGGSPLQVSGPAAGLAVLVWQFVEKYGLPALGWIVLGAGILQVTSGIFKFGRWFRAVSPSVIQGMLAGIGVLIFASQFHVMVDAKPRGSGIENLLTIPSSIYKGIFPVGGSVHHIAAVVGLIGIGSIVLWTKFRPNKLHSIPGPLVSVVLVTVIATIMQLPIQYVAIPESIFKSFNVPVIDNASLFTSPGFWGAVVGFAIIASAETLLCATAVDRMHSGERTKYDRELIAQGIGNLLCGAVGALPMTGVIVRSSANVEAGAKTRFSAIMHGAWLLLFVVFLPSLIRLIPTSALAAILVYTGYKRVNPAAIKKLWQAGKSEVFIYAATVIAIVSTDLLTGVLVGFGLALVKLLYTFLHLKIVTKVDESRSRVDIALQGTASFVQLPRIVEEFESIPDHMEVHLHLGALAYADHATLELVDDWERRRSGKVITEWDELRARSKGKMKLPELKMAGKAGMHATDAAPSK